MLWIVPAWLVSLVVVFLLGRYLGNISKRITQLEEVVKSKIDKPEEVEPESTIIDPLDPVQEAMYEHKKMTEKLNGSDS